MKIIGQSIVDSATMFSFAKKVNPNFPQIVSSLYLEIGSIYGIRGDVSFCQMLKETAYLRFGGDVTPEQNNFAGIGATGGIEGAYFKDVTEGITAHLQHLHAYATTTDLPVGETLVDPRYNLVTRGIATDWVDLNGKWAYPGTNYGQDIETMYLKMEGEKVEVDEVIQQLADKINRLETENEELKVFKTKVDSITAQLKALL